MNLQVLAKTDAIDQAGGFAPGPYVEYGLWVKDMEEMQYLASLTLEKQIEAGNPNCGDLAENGTQMLNYLRDSLDDWNINSCADAQHYCHSITSMPGFGIDGGKGFMTRLLCSETCGCADPGGEFIFVQGVGGFSIRNRERNCCGKTSSKWGFCLHRPMVYSKWFILFLYTWHMMTFQIEQFILSILLANRQIFSQTGRYQRLERAGGSRKHVPHPVSNKRMHDHMISCHEMHGYVVYTLFGTCKINTLPKFHISPETFTIKGNFTFQASILRGRFLLSFTGVSGFQGKQTPLECRENAGCPYDTKQCITSEPYIEKLQQGSCTEKNVTLKKAQEEMMWWKLWYNMI